MIQSRGGTLLSLTRKQAAELAEAVIADRGDLVVKARTGQQRVARRQAETAASG